MPAKRRRSMLGTIVPRRNRYAARYEKDKHTHTPGRTFTTFALADQWLAAEQLLIDRGLWTPPADRRQAAERQAIRDSLTFGDYSAQWIANRLVRGRPLKERTAADYRATRARWLAPWLNVPIADITRADVAAWYRGLDATKATARSHAYSLFRSIMASAVDDELLAANPVQIRGAGSKRRPADVELFTAEQVGRLADLMPAHHRAAVLLAAWCGLRFGEIAGLRPADVDLPLIHIRRGVVRADGVQYVTTPKSAAGVRTVVVPPHVAPAIQEHLHLYASAELVFPPTHPGRQYLTPGMLYGTAPSKTRKGTGYYGARAAIGRPDLSFHKLRHFAATNYAVAGATTKELMALLGHSEPGVAMRYQHASSSRAAELAARVSALGSGATQ